MTSSLLSVYNRLPLSFTKGEGSYLITETGERYLDFAAGVAVMSLGHCHPELVAALCEQGQKLWHVSNLFTIPEQELFARLLIGRTFADVVFFCNSGAEAVEGAIKVARKYHAARGQGDRYKIVAFDGAFHGRTLATIAAAGRHEHLDGFGPPASGFIQAPWNDAEGVRRALTPDVAAILVEPIQGDGGLRVAERGFLQSLRSIADHAGALLVFDEVQTGMGRLGALYAYEVYGVQPDVLASAKGIGGGFPVGAVLSTSRAASGMAAGTHGSTYGGNPLAMAVAAAAFRIISKEETLAHVREAGQMLGDELRRLAGIYPSVIEEVRGMGLMQGFKARMPIAAVGSALVERKLLTAPAHDNVIRLLPPLTVSREELEEAVGKMESALAHLL